MQNRKLSSGVSPIIATLLLIAITVAAGVIVYVYISGITGNLTSGGGGQQTGQQIELTSYNFQGLSGSACDGNSSLAAPCLIITIKDAGGSAVTIDDIYFNGLALTPVAATSFTPITLATHGDATIALGASGSFSAGEGYKGMPSSGSLSGGSSYVLKIVSTTGGLFSYTVTAGASQ